jgi:hypothetical protein
VARIQNLDHLGQRFVSLTRRDIPEGLRWKGSIGDTRNAHGDRRWLAEEIIVSDLLQFPDA